MENNNVNSSCLMLACALYTPIELGYIFNQEDLTGDGIEFETHITILFARESIMPKDEVISTLYEIEGYSDFCEVLKSAASLGNIIENFELSSFENDTDFLVLKLKKDNPFYEMLGNYNKVMREKFNIPSDFTYTPHITLACLEPGTAKKYMKSDKLIAVLKASRLNVEDLVISYGKLGSNSDWGRDKHNITTFHAVDRHLREQNLKLEYKKYGIE